jgi:hypothetical protein
MQWISEPEAAKILGRKPRTLRKKVKAGFWPVTYTAIDGRAYQYSLNDLNKLLINNSTRTK